MSSSRQEPSHIRATIKTCLQRPLLSYGAIPVFAATLKEAVTHHALTEQKQDDRQDRYKQESSNSERGWLSSAKARSVHLLSSLKLL
jgi:hypothetical protein